MASPEQAVEKKGPKGLPSAKKRQLQNEKCRLRNKAARSCIKNKIRSFREEAQSLGSEKGTSTLREIQGQLDKAAKKGLFKQNKTSRLQSRLAARLRAASK
jgi:small subunit ribosomal protein S20